MNTTESTPRTTHRSARLESGLRRGALAALAVGALGMATGCGGEELPTAVAGAELNGTWSTPCFPTSWAFAKTELGYQDLVLRGSYTEYADEACTQAIHVSRWTGVSTVSGPARGGLTPIDIAFGSFTSSALTAENAAQNNAYQYCGLTDWAAGEERNVLGAACQGFAIPVGAESLDVYLVEGDTLRFGVGAQIGVDLPEAARPTALDPARVFTRK